MKYRILKLACLVAAAAFIGSLMPAPVVHAQGTTNTATTIIASGTSGAKRDIAVIAEGFQSGNDQTTFNNWVTNEVVNGVLARGPFWEDLNALNVVRVNASSTDSGVTRVNSQGNVTTSRNTALGYRVSGVWSRCWSEPGPNTNANLNSILNSLAPGWEFAIIVLNDASAGGCRRGNTLAVSTNVDWRVLQHEMGHMIGNLCDEYVGGSSPGNYTGAEPGCVNLTVNTNRATLKWGQFVSPSTALPTTFNAATMNATETAGAFQGGTLGSSGYSSGIWHPTSAGTMNGNNEPFGPVCYTRLKEVLRPNHEYNYLDTVSGDFNGDGRSDVVVQNANSIALYLSQGSALAPTWIVTGDIPGWEGIRGGDRFYVGDFDGDGRDDIYVVNFTDWSIPYLGMLRATGAGFESVARYDLQLPGWGDMRSNDQFYVADFNGDKRDDLVVFNGRDWSVGYLELLASTGTRLQAVRRYDDVLPGWGQMRPNDQFYIADFEGDERDDVWVFNGDDWSIAYLEMLHSTGSGLQYWRRFDDQLPGWGAMRQHDQFYPANFDGKAGDDLYVFNGRDWSIGYLEILRVVENNLQAVRRYDDIVPGWDRLMPGDAFFVADVNGDKRQDLYAWNFHDWVTEYLGPILSDGSGGLFGYWSEDWVDSWNLGPVDQFLVGNFNGGAGWDDLFVRNGEWFGLLRSHQQSLGLDAIYPKWIHQVEYQKDGWW